MPGYASAMRAMRAGSGVVRVDESEHAARRFPVAASAGAAGRRRVSTVGRDDLDEAGTGSSERRHGLGEHAAGRDR